MWKRVFRCAATTTRRLNRSTLWKSVRFLALSGAHDALKFFLLSHNNFVVSLCLCYEWENVGIEKKMKNTSWFFFSSARSLAATPTVNVMMHDVENTAVLSTTTLIFSLSVDHFSVRRARNCCVWFFSSSHFNFETWHKFPSSFSHIQSAVAVDI